MKRFRIPTLLEQAMFLTILLAVFVLFLAGPAHADPPWFGDVNVNSLNQGHTTMTGAMRIVPQDLAGTSGTGFTISGESIFQIPGATSVFHINLGDISDDTDKCAIGPAGSGASVWVVFGPEDPGNLTFDGAIFGIRNVGSGSTIPYIAGVTSFSVGVPLNAPVLPVHSTTGVTLALGEDFGDIDWFQLLVDGDTGVSAFRNSKKHNH